MKSYWNEEWRELNIEGFTSKSKYEISNYGRIRSFAYDKENGRLKKASIIGGYEATSFKMHNGPTFTKYIHKLTAEHFLDKTSEEQKFVIHLDYDKKNNKIENLKWATKEEKEKHQFSGPNFLAQKGKRHYSKLTESQVKMIKKQIFDPNRKTRLKMIAKQFGISEMQLYRIKKGDNWSSVTDY